MNKINKSNKEQILMALKENKQKILIVSEPLPNTVLTIRYEKDRYPLSYTKQRENKNQVKDIDKNEREERKKEIEQGSKGKKETEERK